MTKLLPIQLVYAFYLALSGNEADLNFLGKDREDRNLKFCWKFLRSMARFQQKKTEGSTKEAYALKTTDDFINKV